MHAIILYVNESHYGCYGYRFAIIFGEVVAETEETVEQRLYSA